MHDPKSGQINYYDGRYYVHEESKEYFPGATTVLGMWPKGEHFYKWLKEVGSNAEKIRDDAALKGSTIHAAIELYLKGLDVFVGGNESFFYSREEWTMIHKFREVVMKLRPTTIAIEPVLVSPELGYGGQLDWVCEFKGDRWLLDHKSSRNQSDTWDMQLAAYKRLWNEKFPQTPIDRCGVVWLNAKTRTEKDMQGIGWQILEVKDYNQSIDDFDTAKKIWNRLNPKYQPMNLTLPDRININDDLKQTENETN